MENPKRGFPTWLLDVRIILGFTLASLVLVAVNLVGYLLLSQLAAAAHQAERTHHLHRGLTALRDCVRDAETAHRGFLVSGQDSFLEQFGDLERRLEREMQGLANHLEGDEAWRDALERISIPVNQKRKELSETVRLHGTDGKVAAQALARKNDGNGVMEELHHLVGISLAEADHLLLESSSNNRRNGQQLFLALTAGTVLTLGLVASTVLLINRIVVRGSRTEATLRQTSDDLEARVYQRTILLTRVNEVLEAEIAERRRTEERASHLATLVEYSEDGILGLDVAGKITAWNPGAERMFGISAAEALGKQWEHLVRPVGPVDLNATLRYVLAANTVPSLEIQHQAAGTLVPLSMGLAPVRGAEKQVVGVSVVARDTTDRRKLEGQLQQAVKMEAVGRLAAGVAHDFNNLLTVILGASEMLLMQLAADTPERLLVESIASAANRSANLTRQLLAFSRQQAVEPRLLDLSAVVGAMAPLLPRLLGNDIHLATALPSSPLIVFADPGQLEHVLLNLAANARDAMPQGGKLTLEVMAVDLDEAYTSHYLGLQPGPYVLLAVSDTGCGMGNDVRAHLFEPFFTTKEKGKGTGLGLAMVYGIVKQNHGHIAVYSEVDRGATIKIYLPRRSLEPGALEAMGPVLPVPGGSETILLVEDDATVCSLVSRVLRLRGYRVLEASEGAEALQVSAKYSQAIDLLVADVVMPGLGGREVADLLVEARPSLKVLFLSGYADYAISHQGILAGTSAFLQKPFTPDALARKVREVLDG